MREQRRAALILSAGLVVAAAASFGACTTTIHGATGGSGGGSNPTGPSAEGGGTTFDTGVGASNPTGPEGGGPPTTSTGTGGEPGGGIVPPAPGGSDPPAPSSSVFAISKMFWGDTDVGGRHSADAWKRYGYDVDHQITDCAGTACNQVHDHCRPNAGGSKAFVYPDGNGGIDNSFGFNILPIFLGIQSDFSKKENDAIASGDWTLLLDVDGFGSASDYNPLAARIYIGASLGHAPRFDGSDVWPVRPESLTDPGNVASAKNVFASSYVVGGVWVSGPRAGAVTLPFLDSFAASASGITIDVRDAVVTFSTHGDHGGRAAGQISGVIAVSDMVSAVREMAGSFDQSLCSGGTINSISQQIKQAADIMIDGSPGTASETCNAISIGLGFEAQRVGLGGVGAASPPPHSCQ